MLRLVTPGTPPADISELRRHARVDHGEDDALLARYLASAVEQVERTSGVGFSGASWRWTGRFPTGALDVGLAPLAGVEVTYVDADDVEQTATAYTLLSSCLVPTDTWPATADGSEVSVEFTSGDGIWPAPLVTAVLMTALSAYESRDGGGALSGPAQMLVGQYRRVWF